MDPNKPSAQNQLTIKDIAQLAGVSIATVSKVINRKDQDIGVETKQKILKIINENNYIPYQKVIKRNIKTATIGLVLSDAANLLYRQFARGVEDCAYEKNMSVIVCNSDAAQSRERKYMDILRERNVEGVIIAPSSSFKEEDLSAFLGEQTPVVIVDSRTYDPGVGHVHIDYFNGAYAATRYLIEKNHELIGYVTGPLTEPEAADKLEGYKKALYDGKINFDASFVYESAHKDDRQTGIAGTKALVTNGATSIVAANDLIASGAYAAASDAMLKIPADLSVVGFGDSYVCDIVSPPLTSIGFPYYRIGYEACEALIRQIQNEPSERKLVYEPFITERGSVSSPESSDDTPKERIAIVGSLNMDIVMKVPHLPKVGETILANDIKNAAGGKGANQAVGAGKLGGKVYMIGRVGNDSYGRELYGSLIKHGVDATGVQFDDLLPTGNAYIYVSDNGDNNIVVNPGANSRLSVQQVSAFEGLFDQVAYCLIQMEIPMDTIEYVSAICRSKNIKLILNPAPARAIDYEQFAGGYLVIPNETEIDLMIPGEKTIQEKARELLGKGFQNVIVTLGEKGCVWVNEDTEQYFPAATFKAVDTTGAGDSFISGLTVALSEGKEMAEAIRFASIAAGITVSREGAQPSLPDQETIRMYL